MEESSASKHFDDIGNRIFLEKANAGDTGCSGLHTVPRVGDGDSTQRDYRKTVLASPPQLCDSRGLRAFFLEDGRKDGKVRALSAPNIFFRMT